MITAIESLVTEMLDDVIGSPPIEIVEHFALPLQSRALTILLKMPMDAADEWISWGQHVFHGEHGQSVDKGNNLDRYLHKQFDLAEAEPGDDLFSELVKAKFRGRSLTRDEMVGFANLVFAGGRDTIIATVSLALAHLATHSEDMNRLRDNPLLIRSAVEEIVRIATPLTLIGRTCPRDTNVHGEDVHAGDRVALCWASANRDETVFEAPDELKIDRKRNAHVGFGAGPHMCLGASHARLLLRTLIKQVCDKTAGLSLVDSRARLDEWPSYCRQTGFDSLHIEFQAQTAQ